MTPAEFRKRLKALGMTQRDFAARLSLNYRSVERWGKFRAGREYVFPGWVSATLSAWERSIELADRYLQTDEGAAEAIAELVAREKIAKSDNNPPMVDFPVDAPGSTD